MGADVSKWPPELDAMTAAADNHAVLLENDQARVLDSWVRPGESTPIHTHEWPSVLYVIGSSDFVRYNAEGQVIYDSRENPATLEPGQAFWSEPVEPHFVTNVGGSDIRIISVEIKPKQ